MSNKKLREEGIKMFNDILIDIKDHGDYDTGSEFDCYSKYNSYRILTMEEYELFSKIYNGEYNRIPFYQKATDVRIYYESDTDYHTDYGIIIKDVDDNVLLDMCFLENKTFDKNKMVSKVKQYFNDLYPVEKKEIKTKKFKFGKYKGKSISVVFEEDKQYIDWCLNNVRGFYI